MLPGIGTGLLLAGLIVALDLVTFDLAVVDDEALGAILAVAGVLMLGLTLVVGPPQGRVVYVDSSRDDRVRR